MKQARKSGEKLLEAYRRAKKVRRFDESRLVSASDITLEKQRICREYPLLMKRASKRDYMEFVWEALAKAWIDDKIVMILDEIAGFGKIGELYKAILEKTYLNDKPLDVESLYRACGLGRSAYFNRCKEATALFGILTYKYAKRREDVALGVVGATERLIEFSKNSH